MSTTILTRDSAVEILVEEVLQYLKKKTPGVFDSSVFRTWRHSTCRHGYMFHECPNKAAGTNKCLLERPTIIDDDGSLLREACQRLANAGFLYRERTEISPIRFVHRVKPFSNQPIETTTAILNKIAAMQVQITSRPRFSDAEHLAMVELRKKGLSFRQIAQVLSSEFKLKRTASTIRDAYRRHLANSGACPACERAKLLLTK